jgi:hypothetical protein
MMKAFSNLTRPGMMFVAALALVLTMAQESSFATSGGQVARNLFITTTAAKCCVMLGPRVKINEPVTVAPVIVTWSADYIVFDTVQFALSLNGGPCLFYGPSVANLFASGTASSFISGTFQWVILPRDGLKKGTNTFTVCGGGVGKAVTMSVGSNTLTVQGSN